MVSLSVDLSDEWECAVEYSVPAVENAARLLKHLQDAGRRSMTLAEVCDAAGVPRSSGFAIMKTLEKHGLVRSDVNKHYRLGWALVGLGASASEQTTSVEVLRPYLRALGEDTRLTCVLARRVGDELMIVEKIESTSDIRVTATVGRLYPLAAGALGKLLLAFAPQPTTNDYMSRRGLPSFTRSSITDPETFVQELTHIRSVGYARSLGEYVEGVNVVAAPVFSAGGEVDLTVATLGLASLLPPEKTDEFGARVLRAGREMTQAIGGPWSLSSPVSP